jgi:hypothetical protein
MDEQDVLIKARAFIAGLDLSNIRESLEPYLTKANAPGCARKNAGPR